MRRLDEKTVGRGCRTDRAQQLHRIHRCRAVPACSSNRSR
jgi:hypothetical protein